MSSINRKHCWFLFYALLFVYILVYMANTNNSDQSVKNKLTRNILELSHSTENYDSPYNPTQSNIRTQLYFVNSEKCKMPYIDPFAPEVMTNYKPQSYESCSNESALVTPLFDLNLKRYVLHIDEELIKRKLCTINADYNCYYQEVITNHDDNFKLSERQYFSQDFVVPPHVESIILGCEELGNSSNVLQRDAYSLIQYKALPPSPPISARINRKASVLMFGIDSLSRINLRRTMPKVFEYLSNGDDWIEMEGYNKVADNTFPNLLAILTGYVPESAKINVCDTDERSCMDRFPFVWRYFNNASYLTAYAEDESGLNTFVYVKPSFTQQPTDYYMLPFLRAFETNLEVTKCTGLRYCIGRHHPSSYVYNFGCEFARRYVDERPIWGLFWSNHFSHNDYAMPSKMEGNILQYLEDLEIDGILDESIVIFFSDHGHRYGYLMDLSSGFIEERTPMMFIHLPPWFRSQYPQYLEALKVNRNRLTSNFDLHNTLLHIIELGGTPDGPVLPKAHDCPNCHSLFYPMDEHRTCEDAGISEHWCTCVPFKRVQGEWTKQIAPLTINRMNEYLVAKNLTSLCSNLTLNYVFMTEMKYSLDHDFHADVVKQNPRVYRIKFKVNQNSADFMATVVFNNITQEVDVDVETISRLNSYAEDSTCIQDKNAKLYCFCYSDLKN